MDSANIIRLLDIFVIGPATILFAYNIRHLPWLLCALVVSIGMLTIVYNYINFNRLYRGTDPRPYTVLPTWVQNLFWHPVNGKTQLLRLINLFVMYPILFYAWYYSIEEGLYSNVVGLFMISFGVLIGFIYNLYYFVKIALQDEQDDRKN